MNPVVALYILGMILMFISFAVSGYAWDIWATFAMISWAASVVIMIVAVIHRKMQRKSNDSL